MKKRILISSVLMSAVLACALGTGTYAWYVAGAGAMQTATATATVTTAKDNTVSVGNLKFVLSLDNDTTPDLVDNTGKTYYWKSVAGGEVIQDTTKRAVDSLTVAVTTAPTADELKSIPGAYKLSITANNAKARITNDEAPYAGSSVQADLYLVIANDGTYKICSDKAGTTVDNSVNYSIMAATDAVDTDVTVEFTVSLSATPEA